MAFRSWTSVSPYCPWPALLSASVNMETRALNSFSAFLPAAASFRPRNLLTSIRAVMNCLKALFANYALRIGGRRHGTDHCFERLGAGSAQRVQLAGFQFGQFPFLDDDLV